MTVEIQFCMKDFSDPSDEHIFNCTYCDEGVLYYPEIKASDIKGNMETFYATYECTECDNFQHRNNTAPRYLTWRVVVSR